jgi:hypothetical protein
MSDLNNRGDALENKFAHDEQTLFKVEARGCKLVGMWAAEKLGMTEEKEQDAYAKEVVVANLEEIGLDDVKRKIAADFKTKGISFDDAEFDTALTDAMTEAKKQISEEV